MDVDEIASLQENKSHDEGGEWKSGVEADGWGDGWRSGSGVTDCSWGSSTQGPIQRWSVSAQCDVLRSHSNIVKAHEEFMSDTDEQQQPVINSSFAEQISASEYTKQTREYTRLAVQQLVNSPEYQRVYTRCKMCWCSWSEGECTECCVECGGYTMHRPCPICRGKCDSVWKRDVDMSHSSNEAHWDGECHLPDEQRTAYLHQYFMDEPATEQDILDGMEQLQTD